MQWIHDSALQSALMRDPGRDSNWGQKFQKGSLKLFYQCARAAAAERHFACKSHRFQCSTHLNIMWGGGDSKWIDIYHRLKGRYWTEESYNIFQNINVDQWTENTQSEPYILLYVQYTLSTVYMYVCVCVCLSIVLKAKTEKGHFWVLK